MMSLWNVSADPGPGELGSVEASLSGVPDIRPIYLHLAAYRTGICCETRVLPYLLFGSSRGNDCCRGSAGLPAAVRAE